MNTEDVSLQKKSLELWEINTEFKDLEIFIEDKVTPQDLDLDFILEDDEYEEYSTVEYSF